MRGRLSSGAVDRDFLDASLPTVLVFLYVYMEIAA